ncbi:hypothetical protein TrVE_jg1501 [Triparma verrucosa]|uniref:CRC domain-containing protein n=1 Tax=Triparma verrucosa TaxID=1606542 RepID=A0A9W7ENB2_9STRA|nr:hypothetical protein TrVE_jg1501 [Triparma verrucosa]
MEPTSPTSSQSESTTPSSPGRLRPPPVDTGRNSSSTQAPPPRPPTIVRSPPLSPFASFASNLSPLSHHSSPLTSPPNPRRRRPMSGHGSMGMRGAASPSPLPIPPTALSNSLGHEAMDYTSPHMPLHADGGWGAGGGGLVGRRELQSPPGILSRTFAERNQEQPALESPSATVISTGSGSMGAPANPHGHPPSTSSSSSSPLNNSTAIEHVRIQASLPTTPTNGTSTEHNLMMMNDPLLAGGNGSVFQPTTTNKGFVSLVDISSVNAADAAASRLASDANPNLLDSAKKPMSQPTKRLKMMGDDEARSGYVRLSDEWGGIATVDDGEDIYNDLIGEGGGGGEGVVAAAGDDMKIGEDGGISPFNSLPPSPSTGGLDDGINDSAVNVTVRGVNEYIGGVYGEVHGGVQGGVHGGAGGMGAGRHNSSLQTIYSSRRPPRKKSTGGSSKKKRSKNKPFDSPDFVTPTNVDIYVGSVKAENAEHALQLINRGEESWCKCRKSRCLKLYCDCFQAGNNCRQNCGCVECLNTVEHSGKDGIRTNAVINALLRRPDAFEKRVRELGNGCGCKNSGCLKKYCECFREGNLCNPDVCKCQGCKNLEGGGGGKKGGSKSGGRKLQAGSLAAHLATPADVRSSSSGIITPSLVNRGLQLQQQGQGQGQDEEDHELRTPVNLSASNSPNSLKPNKMSRLSPEGGGRKRRSKNMVVTPPYPKA